jgi:hypothetical protein
VVLSTDPLGPGPLPLAGMEGIDGIEGKPSAGTGFPEEIRKPKTLGFTSKKLNLTWWFAVNLTCKAGLS